MNACKKGIEVIPPAPLSFSGQAIDVHTCEMTNLIEYFLQHDDGKWRRTEFSFESERVDVLPLEDLSFFHRAVGNEQFGLKIGPVCYR